MSATRKKAIVRQWNGELHRGYLPVTALSRDGYTELLLPDARVVTIAMAAVKHIAFVRDFNLTDAVEPERIGQRTFPSKPRSGGAWVSVHFTDGDSLEGLAQAGLPLLDALLLDHGVFLEPADRRSNTARLFVPRSAMSGFELLGVAGSSSRARRLPSSRDVSQGDLFMDAQEE